MEGDVRGGHQVGDGRAQQVGVGVGGCLGEEVVLVGVGPLIAVGVVGAAVPGSHRGPEGAALVEGLARLGREAGGRGLGGLARGRRALGACGPTHQGVAGTLGGLAGWLCAEGGQADGLLGPEGLGLLHGPGVAARDGGVAVGGVPGTRAGVQGDLDLVCQVVEGVG